MTTRHIQVNVVHPHEGLIEVDADIAPLLQLLWLAGVNTIMSCQDTSGHDVSERTGWVWIEFDTVKSLNRFLNIVVAGLADTDTGRELRSRMTDNTPLRNSNNWTHWVAVIDLSIEEPACYDTPILVSINTRFPRSDYPAVLAAVEATAGSRPSSETGTT